AKDRQVLFVEPPARWSPKLGVKATHSPAVRQIKPNLLAFRPATPPFPYRAPALLRPIWRLPIHLQQTKPLKEAGFETFDVLTFDPHCQPFLDRCRSQLNRVVYYAVDPPLGAEDIRWPERRLVRDSNSVLAVTERLAQLLRKV